MSLSIEMIFANWKRHAEAKGWKVPPARDPTVSATAPAAEFPMETWISYWMDCDEYERDPSKGRPVVPHRPGQEVAP